jgi:hypothetical protein
MRCAPRRTATLSRANPPQPTISDAVEILCKASEKLAQRKKLVRHLTTMLVFVTPPRKTNAAAHLRLVFSEPLHHEFLTRDSHSR